MSAAPLMRRETAPLAEWEQQIDDFTTFVIDFVNGVWIEVLISTLVVVSFFAYAKPMWFRGGTTKVPGGPRKRPKSSLPTVSKVVLPQEQSHEAQQVQMFVVSLLQKGGRSNPALILDQYQELKRTCGPSLRKYVPDNSNARSMYLALISSAVNSSAAGASANAGSAWQVTSQLVSDMKAFDFPRDAEFYGTALKIFGNAQLFREGMWLYDAMLEDKVEIGNGLLSYLLTMAVSCGEFTKALTFFDRLAAVSLPTVRAIMTVLRAYGAKKDFRDRKSVV